MRVSFFRFGDSSKEMKKLRSTNYDEFATKVHNWVDSTNMNFIKLDKDLLVVELESL